MAFIPPEPCEDWYSREQRRFRENLYIKPAFVNKLPIYNSETVHHFVHHSVEKDGYIAYTPNDAYGKLDRTIRMKPGRYLKKFYPDLPDEVIRDWALKCEDQVIDIPLQLATTREEIREVYAKGPSSCMSGDWSDGGLPGDMHPAEVYAAGDLAIGYLGRGGRVSARALCWPEKKIYGRLYGDEYRLESAFENAGYSYDPRKFVGAKLLRIESGSSFVGPYLDHDLGAYDDGEHLIVTYSDSELACQGTSGYFEDSRATCENCGDAYDDGDGVWIADREEYWCPYCASNEANECDCCGDVHSHSRGSGAYVNGGDVWVCERCLERSYFLCNYCDEYHPNRECNETRDGDVCDDCLNEHYTECPECEEFVKTGDIEESGLCEDCEARQPQLPLEEEAA